MSVTTQDILEGTLIQHYPKPKVRRAVLHFQTSALYLYKTHKPSSPLSIIPILDAKCEERAEINLKHRYFFSITGNWAFPGEIFLFSCSTPAQRSTWVDSVNSISSKNKGDDVEKDKVVKKGLIDLCSRWFDCISSKNEEEESVDEGEVKEDDTQSVKPIKSSGHNIPSKSEEEVVEEGEEKEGGEKEGDKQSGHSIHAIESSDHTDRSSQDITVDDGEAPLNQKSKNSVACSSENFSQKSKNSVTRLDA
eukprot:sb/3468750/